MQSLSGGVRTGFGLLAKLANGLRAGTDLARRGADLARGPNAQNKLPAAAWSNTWPAPAATLDLDFANNRGFVRGSGQGGAMDAVTFTRASSGNWVDNTGVLRTGAGTFTGTANATGVNLLSVPQDFDNASWSKTSCTVSGNVIVAPDGTLTADKIINGTGGGTAQCFIGQTNNTFAINTSGVFSVYLKAGELTWAVLGADSFTDGFSGIGQRIWFDLANGVVSGSPSSAGATGTITSVGNGWYRCAIAFNSFSPTATANFRIFLSNSSGTTNSTQNNLGIYAWGAQLEVGASATTYYPTNINAPRFDWASTTVTPNVNLFTCTEQFDNAVWVVFGTASKTGTNVAVAPDGTTTADSIRVIAANSQIYQSVSLPANVTYTFSCYVMRNAASNQTFRLKGQTNSVTDTFSSDLTATSAWQRFSFTWTTNISGSLTISVAGNTSGVQADLLVWGAQLEVGSSATAYQSIGAQVPTNTPLVANSTCNGLLIEESRTNRILWCRDATSGTGTNLLPRSQLFSNAAWAKTGLAVTSENNTAPDSTATAALVTLSAGSSNHQILQGPVSIASGILHTSSIYLKAGNWNYYTLDFYSTATAWASISVDLSTGTITRTGNGSGGTYVSSSITNVGSGWYRISLTCSLSATSGSFLLQYASVANPTIPSNNFGIENPWTAAGTETGYLWGAQLEVGQAVTSYTATTTSQLFGWSKSSVTVAKTATGIDGVANAATAITATANNAYCLQPISLASGSRTASVYLKRISGTGNVQVTLDGSTWSTVDLSNGLWNRIVLSGTVTNPCVGVLLATNGDAVAMDYAQVEDGAFVTSPILTTTATATRSQDNTSISGANASQIGITKGEIISNHIKNNTATAAIYSFNGTGFTALLFADNTGSAAFTIDAASRVGQFALRNNIVSGFCVGSYRTSEYLFSNNGVAYSNQVSSGANLPQPISQAVYIGVTSAFANPLTGYIKSLTFIPSPQTQITVNFMSAGRT